MPEKFVKTTRTLNTWGRRFFVFFRLSHNPPMCLGFFIGENKLSDNKKYYYLKLKENFFESEEIKLLEAGENGYLYSNIYLRLLLKADYLKSGYRYIDLSKYENKYTLSKIVGIFLSINHVIINKSLEVIKHVGLISINNMFLTIKDVNFNFDRDRTTAEYIEWRKNVFIRDDFTCRICGTSKVALNAHHILRWATHKHERFSINNGITVCVDCHKLIHSGGYVHE